MPVYTPLILPLHVSTRTSIQIQPGESFILDNFSWDLHEFSSGGCSGPTYGDLIEPGNYLISCSLYLDSDYYSIVEMNSEKWFAVVEQESEKLTHEVTSSGCNPIY